MNNRILLVDDEKDIANLLEEVLRKEGFEQIRKTATGQDALTICMDFKPDVVVLDIMLPDMDGIEVCRRIRAFSHCSILFLSSKNDDIDKILGLSAGGDDYVTKPFSPKEIVYRIKAQLRRIQYTQADITRSQNEVLCVDNITLDIEAGVATVNSVTIELTAKELKLLQYFMENVGKIISKERLYEQVWGEESAICDNTIMVHIRHLREKIEADPSSPHRLLTIKGLGYKMVGGDLS